MAPSIRVSQDVYNGLRTMIETSYANTISGVIERFLREEGIIQLEQSLIQNTEFEEEKKSKENKMKNSSFSDTEEKEFMMILGESIRKHRYQRAAMREVFSKYNGDKEKTIRAYAWLDEKGYAPRKNDTHKFTPMYYAKALYNDGINKGWLK